MRISKKHVIYSMDKDHAPVATIKDGETITFETMDCYNNTIASEADCLDPQTPMQYNPATGPVYVEGAEPGDTLRITIREITLDDQGVIVASPPSTQFGLSGITDVTVVAKIVKDFVDFEGHLIPLRKMIGVIGTAPAGEGISTELPGEHGGNMDVPLLQEGAVLYLPVNVPGALLAVGDCHAAMGDGEIISGLETAANVTLTVEVLRGFDLPLPIIETKDTWVSVASGTTMEEAGSLAVDQMTEIICKISDLDYNRARMILSLAGDLRVCQVVNDHKTMRVELPKSVLK